MSQPSAYMELVDHALGRSTKAETLAGHVLVLARRSRAPQPEDISQAVLLNMMARPPMWVDAIADRSPAARRVLQGSRELDDVESAGRAFDAYVLKVFKNRIISDHREKQAERAGFDRLRARAEEQGLVVEPGTGGAPGDVGMHPDSDADADQLFREGLDVLDTIAAEIRETSAGATHDARILFDEMIEFALSPKSLLARTLGAHVDPLDGKRAYDACTQRHSRLRREMAQRLERGIANGHITAEAGSSAWLLLNKFLNRRPKAGG